MKKRKLILPQGYLSQNQVNIWLASPERYKKIYFERQWSNISNYGTKFGSVVADSLEEGTEVDDSFTASVLLDLIKYEHRDKEIRVEFKNPAVRFDLLGKIDTLNPETGDFREYKTGTSEWTEWKAKNHFQIYFYQVLVYLKYGKMPKVAYLDWMPTIKNRDGSVEMEGSIKTFAVPLDTKTLLHTMNKIQRVAIEIDNAYMIYLQSK
jgi:hypothetical protein